MAEPNAAALVEELRWAADDLKAYYMESATAQPGDASQAEI